MAYLGARKSGYEMRRLGIREGGFSDLLSSPSLTIADDEGAVITTNQSGAISVTIAGTTYTQDVNAVGLTVAGIIAAPMALTLPTFTGTVVAGEVVPGTAAIWLYVGEIEDPTHTVTRDGVTVADHSGLNYTILGDDQATDLVLVEAFGGETVSSAALSIPAPTLASDPLALLYLNPANVTTSSGDLTAWPNDALNGSADNSPDTQVTGSSLPVWNAVDERAEFDGTMALRSGTNTQPFTDQVVAGETLVTFLIIDTATNASMQEVLTDTKNSGAGQAYTTGYRYTGSDDVDVKHYGRAATGGITVAAFGGNTNVEESDNSPATGKHIFRYTVSPTSATVHIDGQLESTLAVSDVANLATDNNMRTSIGGRCSATAINNPFYGNLYEAFVTTAASNVAFFEAELATKHGITLL